MTDELKKLLDDQSQALDDDVREAIALAGGDVKHALRVTLIANYFLLEEVERLKEEKQALEQRTSKGFTRRAS